MQTTVQTPRRMACATCGVTVLEADLPGGRAILVDHDEMILPEADDQVLVAVDEDGHARTFNVASMADGPGPGEAIYRPHGCL